MTSKAPARWADSMTDDFAVLDLLDALVRKSLLVADRSSGRTRFSMLETIRQFAEEQLAARGESTDVRTTHARYFAGREPDVLALWDSPRQREAYDWFTVELANLRTAFRWAADHGDLDVAAPIATYAGFLGLMVENYEPIAWAEELIEPARAVDHPRLAFLYVMASQCCMTGRIEAAVGYSEAGQYRSRRESRCAAVRHRRHARRCYMYIGQPERWVELCRAQLATPPRHHVHIRACLVFALVMPGSGEEAMASADGLIEAAEATRNPSCSRSRSMPTASLSATPDPGRALDAFRRGLAIAQDSGNRFTGTQLAIVLGSGEAEHGDNASAFDHLGLAIRNITTRATSLRCAPPWLSSPLFSIGSTAMKRRPLSPVSRSVLSPR